MDWKDELKENVITQEQYDKLVAEARDKGKRKKRSKIVKEINAEERQKRRMEKIEVSSLTVRKCVPRASPSRRARKNVLSRKEVTTNGVLHGAHPVSRRRNETQKHSLISGRRMVVRK